MSKRKIVADGPTEEMLKSAELLKKCRFTPLQVLLIEDYEERVGSEHMLNNAE